MGFDADHAVEPPREGKGEEADAAEEVDRRSSPCGPVAARLREKAERLGDQRLENTGIGLEEAVGGVGVPFGAARADDLGRFLAGERRRQGNAANAGRGVEFGDRGRQLPGGEAATEIGQHVSKRRYDYRILDDIADAV